MPSDEQLEFGPQDCRAVAILVHGRGGSPHDMAALARRLDQGDVRFIMPAAPGGSWYPQRFMSPRAQNEPFLTQALDRYANLIEGTLARGIPAERIVIGGFSQGACLTAQMLLSRPQRYGAALVLTGGLIGEIGTAWTPEPALAGTPVLLTSSEVDEWIPLPRVHETARFLRASGVALTMQIFAERPHLVCAEEIALARAMLSKVAT
jgi:predicted esterase